MTNKKENVLLKKMKRISKYHFFELSLDMLSVKDKLS